MIISVTDEYKYRLHNINKIYNSLQNIFYAFKLKKNKVYE